MNTGSDWKKSWALAAAVIVCVTLAVEFTARALGESPTIRDDPALWSYWRDKAKGAEADTIILVGSSRIMTDVNLAAWRGLFPGRKVIQLAISGSSFLPVLEDLAAEESFRGTVVCDIIFPIPYADEANRYLDYYHHSWNASEKFLRMIRTFLQTHFILANPQGLKRRLFTFIRDGRFSLKHIEILPDRSIKADYQKRKWKPDGRNRAPFEGVSDKEALLHYLHAIQRSAHSIIERGGHVVLVEFPTTGELLISREKHYKRVDYFNTVEKTTGLEFLSVEEIPGAAAFDCPDESHLDFRDAPRYTRLLASTLKERGLL